MELQKYDMVDLLDYLQENDLYLSGDIFRQLNKETQKEALDFLNWLKKYELDNNTDNLYLFVYKNDMGTWFDEIKPAIESGALSEKQIKAIEGAEVISVVESVKNEFNDFRKNELEKSKEEIFKDYYVIHFYEELSNFLIESCYNDLEDIHYECLLKDKGHILWSLYQYYLKSEYASINSYEDIKDLIVNYNKKYHNSILYK